MMQVKGEKEVLGAEASKRRWSAREGTLYGKDVEIACWVVVPMCRTDGKGKEGELLIQVWCRVDLGISRRKVLSLSAGDV